MTTTTNRVVSVFLAHKKQETDVSINAMLTALKIDIDRQAGINSRVTAGRDDYKDRASSLGGWQAWQRDVATGETIEGCPRFDALVSPDKRVGKATAQMLFLAGTAGKDVYYWDGRALHTINEVRAVDEEDWKNGWALRS
jgi:hypothetical protein